MQYPKYLLIQPSWIYVSSTAFGKCFRKNPTFLIFQGPLDRPACHDAGGEGGHLFAPSPLDLFDCVPLRCDFEWAVWQRSDSFAKNCRAAVLIFSESHCRYEEMRKTQGSIPKFGLWWSLWFGMAWRAQCIWIRFTSLVPQIATAGGDKSVVGAGFQNINHLKIRYWSYCLPYNMIGFSPSPSLSLSLPPSLFSQRK